jgi:very-short-patch-repair endonuclease
VVEIDGGQHLGDADAWRRDRRKDATLRANGYFALRFLAMDLGKNLNLALDTARRTLTTSRSRSRTQSLNFKSLISFQR